MKQKDKKLPGFADVFIVDDHPAMCEGLKGWISREPGMRVCGTAAGAFEAIKGITATRPDVAIVDIQLTDSNGLDLAKQIRHDFPDIRILILSAYDETMYAERAIQAGAHGYVTKNEAVENIVGAIRKVLGGQIYVSNKMSNILLQKFANTNNTAPKYMDVLTNRELEIFTLLGQGLDVRTIANKVKRSVKTIEVHRDNIRKKLNLETSIDLVRYATRQIAQNQPLPPQGIQEKS